MRQRSYFRTKDKNNLGIGSYVRCLTQRNCKGLKVIYLFTLPKTFIITSVET